jgi:YHS domain-containing protein
MKTTTAKAMKTPILALATVLAAGLVAGCGSNNHDHHNDHDHTHHHNHESTSHNPQPTTDPHHHHDGGAERPDFQGDPYTLATCPVSGKKLGSMGDPVIHSHEGREIRFCCAGCFEPFETNPERHLKAVDEAMVQDQRKLYALETCPISGMNLGSMGEPYPLVHNNRLVLFCCQGCDTRFLKNPAPALAQLDAAVVAQQGESYPLNQCFVSEEPLVEVVERVWASRLLRFCCNGCAKDFLAEPVRYLKRLDL